MKIILGLILILMAVACGNAQDALNDQAKIEKNKSATCSKILTTISCKELPKR